MIRAIITAIAQGLVSDNAAWLNAIRTPAHLMDDKVTDGIEFKGLTDTDGNSGYIRFRRNETIVFQELKRLSNTEYAAEVVIPLRLVVMAKTQNAEDLAWALAVQLNAIDLSAFDQYFPRVKSRSVGANTPDVVKQETRRAEISVDQRVVLVDFDVIFKWRQRCVNGDMTLPVDFPDVCNCEHNWDLGCIDHCDDVTIPIEAEDGVDYYAYIYFNGTVTIVSLDTTTGEQIVIPSGYLNEAFEACIQIKLEDESVVLYTEDDVDYGCFIATVTHLGECDEGDCVELAGIIDTIDDNEATLIDPLT